MACLYAVPIQSTTKKYSVLYLPESGEDSLALHPLIKKVKKTKIPSKESLLTAPCLLVLMRVSTPGVLVLRNQNSKPKTSKLNESHYF